MTFGGFNFCTMELLRKVPIIVAIFTFLNIAKGQPDPQCEGTNRGRSFVITFPGNYESDADSIELSVLVVALGDNTTSVTLSSMFDSFQSTLEIEPMQFSWVSIPSEFALSMKSEKSNKAIQVVADSEISVYGLNYQRTTTNAILGIPTDSLEDNYVQMGVVESIDSPSLFVVVGVKENYTQVEVNLTTSVTFDGQTYPAGSPLEFSVARNEVVQIV
ncbi:hypothetical protein HOLleu_18639 [Holothuria leucospilota]|uniref:IgGFc-binding protein N-terminal domain-containing protein n=1 Tax=Holothuria leucospilota TaxID=206669 RepID=A0A9Q1C4F6_HOLLE|nr:hypothetical protein HOLleu_18639 [Holothuria leucospilota]